MTPQQENRDLEKDLSEESQQVKQITPVSAIASNPVFAFALVAIALGIVALIFVARGWITVEGFEFGSTGVKANRITSKRNSDNQEVIDKEPTLESTTPTVAPTPPPTTGSFNNPSDTVNWINSSQSLPLSGAGNIPCAVNSIGGFVYFYSSGPVCVYPIFEGALAKAATSSSYIYFYPSVGVGTWTQYTGTYDPSAGYLCRVNTPQGWFYGGVYTVGSFVNCYTPKNDESISAYPNFEYLVR